MMICEQCETELTGATVICKSCGHNNALKKMEIWREKRDRYLESINVPIAAAAAVSSRTYTRDTGNLIRFPKPPMNGKVNDAKPETIEPKPEWKENITDPLQDKLQLIGYPFSIENIFPWQDELSEGIDASVFALSHLTQPDLFLRIRPGYKQQVIQKFQTKDLYYTEPIDNCIALPNNTKIDELMLINKEVVVQDYSSQRIAEFLQITKADIKNPKSEIAIWDCCAASGGKSILAYDVLGNIDLTVSDVRSSILDNLKQRFAEAGIKKYKSYELDLTKPVPKALPLGSGEGFNLIICDVPCTGSGTWGRTPEQLHFFTSEKIIYYSNLQKKIAQNVIKRVKKDGYFLYITCSVFKKENEEVVDFILTNSGLQLVKKEILIGYNKKADTMFGALFKL